MKFQEFRDGVERGFTIVSAEKAGNDKRKNDWLTDDLRSHLDTQFSDAFEIHELEGVYQEAGHPPKSERSFLLIPKAATFLSPFVLAAAVGRWYDQETIIFSAPGGGGAFLVDCRTAVALQTFSKLLGPGEIDPSIPFKSRFVDSGDEFQFV